MNGAKMRSAAIKVGIGVRALHRSRGCSTAFPVRFRFSRELTTRSAAFTQASENVNKLPNVDNSTKLQLYALYKQATSGPNKTAKPGLFDIVGRAKWEGWSALGDMSHADAEREYVKIVAGLTGSGADEASSASSATAAAAAGGSTAAAGATSSGTGAGSGHVQTSLSPAGVMTVTLNRPDKRNALTVDMYEQLIAAFNRASTDPAVRVLVITGTGPYYSAGNDLSNFTSRLPPGGIPQMAADAAQLLERYVEAWIACTKLVVVGVNGPAVGIPVTTLPLADIVLASHKATLHTPFTSLGQSPEAASSVTFPLCMGPARANEMLLLNRKTTAAEGYERGLITEVVEDSQLSARLAAVAAAAAALPPGSLQASKGMVRRGIGIDALREANKRECALLRERWQSEECMGAVMAFLQPKKKAQ